MLGIVVLSLGAMSGCATHRSGDAVKSVHFEGNIRRGLGGILDPQSDRELRNVMTQERGGWQSFVAPGVIEPGWLDPNRLDGDGRRIEVWYANHGFFDAKFLGWEILRPAVPERRKVRPVRLVGHIDQGLPAKVVAVDVQGIEGLLAPIRRRIRGEIVVAEGDRFETDAYRASLAAMRRVLYDNAYAYAEVSGEVFVDADAREVTIRIDVSPGIVCKFGAVTFRGGRSVPDRLLEPLVTIETGKRFSSKPLATTRTNLYGLRAFSVVNVVPDLSDPTQPIVPVTIEVRAAETRELRIGPGFTLEPGLQYIYADVRYSDFNVLKRLWRWENEATAGVASLVDRIENLGRLDPATDIAPIVRVKSTFTMPRLADHWTLANSVTVELGAEQGYRYIMPEYGPSVTYEGIPHFSPTVGYRLKLVDYYTERYQTDVDPTQITDWPFGDDVVDPGLLSLLEQSVVWDGRDDPLQPHHGWYWTVRLAEAGLGGNFNFLRAQVDIRTYRSWVRLWPRGPELDDVVFASRVGGGIIQTYGDAERARVPRLERFYLGGGTTVRGWPADSLGPLDDVGVDRDRTPKGGKLVLHGSGEIRARVLGDLFGAAFVDVGQVWDQPENLRLSELQWSVGPGIRYMTPVGPVRLDFAWVVNQDPAVAWPDPERSCHYGRDGCWDGYRQWALHFGLSEAF